MYTTHNVAAKSNSTRTSEVLLKAVKSVPKSSIANYICERFFPKIIFVYRDEFDQRQMVQVVFEPGVTQHSYLWRNKTLNSCT